MRGSKIFRMQVVALVCIGMIVPHTVLAATPAKVKIHDVALGNGGTLVGQVVDQQGLGIAGAEVVVLQQGQKPVQTVADRTGKFQVVGLKGGTAQVATPGGQSVYRLWTAQTAPPAAKTSAMVLSNGSVVRGQEYCPPTSGGLGGWLLPALAAGGIIAGVAVATSNTSSSPASP